MNYFWPGSVNTHWGPGPVNTNWGPGPGGQAKVRDREIQIPFLSVFTWDEFNVYSRSIH